MIAVAQWVQSALTVVLGAGGVVGLIVWLVRQIVKSAQSNAGALAAAAKLRSDEAIQAALETTKQAIMAAEQKATEMIAAANKAADDRVHDSDLRADEWKETATTYQSALGQQRDIAQKALEVNQMTERYFESLRAMDPRRQHNIPEGTGV